ncbi:MAG TPA: hypothetical protein VK144_00425 [Bacillota bacterium]|nr:hypothetical protein [Bacillota bacterium]
MRKFLLAGITIVMVLFISACGSKEEDEVLDFHNDWVDNVHPIYLEIGDIGEEIMMLSDNEAFEKIEQELIPKVEETEKFFDDYDVETEPATEYYGLRKSANEEFATYSYEARDALAGYLDGTITEEELNNRTIEAMGYMDQFIEKSDQADQRWEEIFDEYGFEEVKE